MLKVTRIPEIRINLVPASGGQEADRLVSHGVRNPEPAFVIIIWVRARGVSPTATVRRIARTIARPAILQPAFRALRGRRKKPRSPFARGGNEPSLRWC